MTNEELFQKRLDGNLKPKSAILDFIPKDAKRILDVGCGTGVLTKEIRKLRPKAEIFALDRNPKMLGLAMDRDCADKYLLSIDAVTYRSVDVIVLSSVLHEIENQEFFMKMLSWYIKPGGRIIVRDGLASSEPKLEKYKLRNPEEAKVFYAKCGDSLIGNLPLSFKDGDICGLTNDVRNFLQTYTWGFGSLPREKNEKFLRLDNQGYQKLAKTIGARKVFCWNIVQADYFDYLDEIVDLKGETWSTHTIAIYDFKED